MSVTSFPIDSVLLAPETDDATPTQSQYPAVAFPALTEQRRSEFLAHLWARCAGDLAKGVSLLNEPGLYTLAAALARSDRATCDATILDELRAELRRRNCRDMGTDPTGSVRRGRLLQLVGAFTPLTPLGTSPAGQRTLCADCPFCAAAASFQVSLPQVAWHCSACDRRGALLEFAENLLELTAPNLEQPPTPGSGPAAS